MRLITWLCLAILCLGLTEALIPILLLKKFLPVPIPLPLPLPIPIPIPKPSISFGKGGGIGGKRINIKLHADIPTTPLSGGVKIGGFANAPGFKVNFEPPQQDLGVQYHQVKEDSWSPPPPPPPTEEYRGWAKSEPAPPTKQLRIDLGGPPATYQPAVNYGKHVEITAHGLPFIGTGSLRFNLGR